MVTQHSFVCRLSLGRIGPALIAMLVAIPTVVHAIPAHCSLEHAPVECVYGGITQQPATITSVHVAFPSFRAVPHLVARQQSPSPTPSSSASSSQSSQSSPSSSSNIPSGTDGSTGVVSTWPVSSGHELTKAIMCTEQCYYVYAHFTIEQSDVCSYNVKSTYLL